MNISLMGLGKLGLPLAAAIASRGHRVVGVDNDHLAIEFASNNASGAVEEGLSEMLRGIDANFRATTIAGSAIEESDISFIVVSTPSEPSGRFSLERVLAVCDDIGKALVTKRSYHLIVVTSTVMPGDTMGPIRKRLEEVSGKQAGDAFGLCYSPEFIALGSVLHDFLNPDFVLIGECDRRAGDLLQQFYQAVLSNLLDRRRIVRTSCVNAEIAKLAINSYVTTKISFANMLGGICDRIQGADVDEVTRAIGMDSRIGEKYLRAGAPFGGPCFPRDNRAIATLGWGELPQCVDSVNSAIVGRIHQAAMSELGRVGGVLGITSLSYKLGTEVTEESLGTLLLQRWRDCGFDVLLGDAAWNADVVVVTLPEQPKAIASLPRVVIDPWRCLRQFADYPGVRYIPLGIGPTGGGAAAGNFS